MSHNPKKTSIHFPASIGLACHNVKKKPKAYFIIHYYFMYYVLYVFLFFIQCTL